jgi:hypothetical protein
VEGDHYDLREKLNTMLVAVLPNVLYNEQQSVVVRQRALLFCSINLDMIFSTRKDCDEQLDRLLECCVNLLKAKT